MAAAKSPSPTTPSSLSTLNHWLCACLTTPPPSRKRSCVNTKVRAPVPSAPAERDCSTASFHSGGRPVFIEIRRVVPSPA